MYVQGIANFVDDISGGLQLLSLSIVVGSLFWALFVLRIRGEPGKKRAAALQRCIRLLRTGAWALAAVQAVKLMAKAAVLASTLGELPWLAYAHTVQFQAGMVRVILALAIAIAAHQLVRQPDKQINWAILTGLMLPLLVSGAWLVHGVGRFEHRELLMALTVLHQLGAAVWVGGVVQLLFLWRLRRRDPGVASFWPVAVARFSALGIASVSLLLATGIALTWFYVGSWDGLLGTGYGSLVAAKIFLLAVTLGFASLNFRAGRLWLRDHHSSPVRTRVPYYVEAETFLLVSILFFAATVSSLPLATDIPNLTARIPEVVEMFVPRVPSLISPSHAALLAGEPGRLAVIGRVPSIAYTEWSNYNHNVSGVFLVVMGLVALLSYVRRYAWAKYWPLGFVALGVFLFFRSDAEAWPLGPVGFWESTAGNAEVLQHRLGTLLALSLGVVEMRVRTGQRASEVLRLVFPILCAFGGILLVTHSHLAFEIKNDFLIQSTHVVMGLLAAVMATGRWLELRLPSAGAVPESRFAGLVAVAAMLMIGAILVSYKEPVF